MASPKVSYSDLELAFLAASDEWCHWLDRHTGRILAYGSEAVLAIREGETDEMPEWMDYQIEAAREIMHAFGELPEDRSISTELTHPEELGTSSPGVVDTYNPVSPNDGSNELGRYVAIEKIPSEEAFQFMEDFLNEIDGSQKYEPLRRALVGNKPFRRFRNVLLDFPRERERWFKYEETRRREYIEEWARDQGVELSFGKSDL